MKSKTLIAAIALNTLLCSSLYAQLQQTAQTQPQAEPTQLEREAASLNIVPVENEIKAQEGIYKRIDLITNTNKKDLREMVKNMEQIKARTAKANDDLIPQKRRINVENKQEVEQYLLDNSINVEKVPVEIYDQPK